MGGAACSGVFPVLLVGGKSLGRAARGRHWTTLMLARCPYCHRWLGPVGQAVCLASRHFNNAAGKMLAGVVLDAHADQHWYKVYRFDDMNKVDREFDTEEDAMRHFNVVLGELRTALPKGAVELNQPLTPRSSP